MLIVLLTFALVFATIGGAYWLFVAGPEAQARAVLRRRLKTDAPVPQRHLSLLKRDAQGRIHLGDELLGPLYVVLAPLQRIVDRAGLKVTAVHVALASAGLPVVVFFSVLRAIKVWPLAALAALIASSAPFLILKHLEGKRMGQLEEQFPEAGQLLARALRAGHTLISALSLAAEELPAPLGTEFKLMHDKQNYGAPVPDVLREFATRIPSLDVRLFVTAVLMQRETGGNLAEVLDRLAGLVRERFRIKGEVRALSAHGRISGWVLAAMPPTIATVIFVTEPDRLMIMFTDPLGIKMVIAAALMQITGMLVVRKLVQIEY